MPERFEAADKEHLKAGEGNYRSYVGPPKRYDFMSLSQIGILFSFGLKETDKVLDFGCGSLRAGRMLIPFLLEGGYFGIEPNQWLIEDGIKHELGQDAITLKNPRFSYNDDFDCTVFNEQFDFILAQSIVTHAGPAMTTALFESASKALNKGGVFLLSYKRGTDQAPLPPEGWSYPPNIDYSPTAMLGLLKDAGFFAIEIPWFHPGAQWIAASLDPEQLPSENDMTILAGQPFQRP